MFIAPVIIRRKPAIGNGVQPQSYYAFSVWWYAFNLTVMVACVIVGVWAVVEDARASSTGRSLRIQNTSSAIVTALQVTLQCLVCGLAITCSAGRHSMLQDIERHLNHADAVLRVSTGQPAAWYTVVLVTFHAALFTVDCYLWSSLSPVTWMYCVCYVYMFIDLATMLMYAHIAWNIGRRFENINKAIECKFAGFQAGVAPAFDHSCRGRGCRPPQQVWTFAGHTSVVVSVNPVATAERQYGTSII